MDWTDTVLRDYVLPELRPDVVIDWMGPLDAAQHDHGVGSAEAKTALGAIDKSLSRTLAAMQALTPARRLDIVVTSDHGFAQHTSGVNVVDSLIAAGVKANAASEDVIVASQGQSVLFYVASHDGRDIARLVAFLQQQPWVDVVFTRGGSQGLGSVAGNVFAGRHARVACVTVARRGGHAQVDVESKPVRRTRHADDRQRQDRAADGRGQRARGSQPVGGPQHPGALGR